MKSRLAFWFSRWPLFLFALLLGALLSACTPPLYVSNEPHVPLHTERGELHLEGELGHAGAGVAGSAALTDHVAVMASGSLSSEKIFSSDVDPADPSTQSAAVEAGLGVYGATGEQQVARYALFAGYGLGKARSLDANTSIFSSGSGVRVEGGYQRFFVQPSIGLVGDYFQASVAARASYVRFGSIHAAQPLDAPLGRYAGPSEVFVMPVFSLGVGPRSMRLVTRVGAMIPLGDEWRDVNAAPSRGSETSAGRPPLYYEPMLFSLGLQVRLSDAF